MTRQVASEPPPARTWTGYAPLPADASRLADRPWPSAGVVLDAEPADAEGGIREVIEL